MFGMGTTLSPKDFARVVRFPWPVCVGVFLQFPERDIPTGTKFETLPADWTCPACDGEKSRFFKPQP